jgi:hypothetical protein
MTTFTKAAVFLAATGIGIFATALVLHPPETSADWAAWAQAVGSVAAIVGTVMVTRMQMRDTADRTVRMHLSDRKQQLEGVYTVARTLHLACGRTQKKMSVAIESQASFRPVLNGFKALSTGGIKALGGIPLHVPPYSGIAREVIVMERAVLIYSRRISKLTDPDIDATTTLAKSRAIADRMGRELLRLRNRIDRVLTADRDDYTDAG